MTDANANDDGPDDASDRTTIRAGRDFEREYRVDTAELGDFLVAVGEQLQRDEKLTVVGDEWELPFQFGSPATLEIDYEGVGDPELGIEVELPGRTDQDAPDVE